MDQILTAKLKPSRAVITPTTKVGVDGKYEESMPVHYVRSLTVIQCQWCEVVTVDSVGRTFTWSKTRQCQSGEMYCPISLSHRRLHVTCEVAE